MRAIVFGGTGFIGSHVVEQLHMAGHSVTVAVRKTSDTSFVARLGVNIVRFDADDVHSISNAINGCDVVYNCTADNKNLHNGLNAPVEINLTKSLVEIAALNGATRFIQLSTIVLYDFKSSEPMDETYNSNPEYPIQRLALEREQVVMEAGMRSGIMTFILRPASTIGVRDVSSFFSRMFIAHTNHQFPIVNGGKARLSLVDTRDIGRAMTFLGEVETTEDDNGIYLLKGFDTSWNGLKVALDEVRGVKSSTLDIPESLSEEQMSQYGLTPFAFKNFTTNRIWNDAKIRSRGFNTMYSLTESVQAATNDIIARV